MAKPERIDLPLQVAIGQRVVRIEQPPYGSPRIYLTDGTFITAVASGSDRVNVYRMPKE